MRFIEQAPYLGCVIKDVVTGFTGRANSYTRWINGTTQYGVSPPVNKEGVLPDPIAIDTQRVEVVDINPVRLPHAFDTEDYEPHVDLGDEVADVITGFKGIVIAVTYFIAGCYNVGVQPVSKKSDEKPRDSEFFDLGRVRMVKPGKVKLNRTEAPKTNPVQVQRRETGGPNRAMPKIHR